MLNLQAIKIIHLHKLEHTTMFLRTHAILWPGARGRELPYMIKLEVYLAQQSISKSDCYYIFLRKIQESQVIGKV